MAALRGDWPGRAFGAADPSAASGRRYDYDGTAKEIHAYDPRPMG